MVVIKTVTGCANAACEAIDSLEVPHVLGTIAGDNTIFLVADAPDNAARVVTHFESMLKE